MIGRPPYGRLAAICAVLSWLTRYWWVFAIALSLISPVSPHLRLTSAERWNCAYLGVRGIIYETHERGCPLIDFVNTRGRGQW